ncbi:MAG: TMEM175 family protein [Flavisolibacter sp.]
MGKGRLEAFSDGVLAIIITIMVLELKLPQGNSLEALSPLWPVFMCYVLSFVNIGIYWNNHHHMLHATEKVNGSVLWANAHLLFWLSLIPFATSWMGENRFALWPVVFYGIILMMAGSAYYLLARCLMNLHGRNSIFSKALGKDIKGKISVFIYILGIGLCFIHPLAGFTLYVLVAVTWFIPDKRFEKTPPK